MVIDRLMNMKEQEACKALFDRSADGAADYAAFRERFKYDRLNGCWIGEWCGMIVGIEENGYTHS